MKESQVIMGEMFYVTHTCEIEGSGLAIPGCVGFLPVFESFDAAVKFAGGNEDAVGVLLSVESGAQNGDWAVPADGVQLVGKLGVYTTADNTDGQTCSNAQCRKCGAQWSAIASPFADTDKLECVVCGAFDSQTEVVPTSSDDEA